MRPTRARIGVGITLGLLSLAAWGVVAFLHPALGPSVRAVSAERLRQFGIVLANPFPWDQATVTQADAENIAVKQGPGGPVLQSVLAEVILTNPTVKPPRLCWIVSLPGSLVVSHGPPGSRQIHASFYLVLIDAHTGEFVEGNAGS